MARAKTATPPAPSPYDLIGVRLQAIISSPKAQREKLAVLSRLPDEPECDWEQVLSDLADIDNVRVARQDDGSIQIRWVVPRED